MKQKVQWTERDDVFLQGCFFLAEADLCTLLLSTYILWLSKKACSAQIAVGELRSGKETGTTFLYSEMLYSEKQKCHIPIQPAVLLTAVETKQTPYFIAGYAGTIHLSSCFFSPESPVFGGVIEKSCPSKPWLVHLLPWFWYLTIMDAWEEICVFVLYFWTSELLRKLEHMLFRTESCVVGAGLLQSS